jgi:flagellar hook-basal body complex protein FliE
VQGPESTSGSGRWQLLGLGQEPLADRGAELRFLRADESPASSGSAWSLGGFPQALTDAIHLDRVAGERLVGLATGATVEVHEALIASARSEIAFQLMVEVRNKLVDAWREVTGIPI